MPLRRDAHIRPHPSGQLPLPRCRNDLLPLNNQNQNPCFDNTHLPQLIIFLRRTGLGFTRDHQDGILNGDSEIEDLDVGPVGDLALDLDL